MLSALLGALLTCVRRPSVSKAGKAFCTVKVQLPPTLVSEWGIRWSIVDHDRISCHECGLLAWCFWRQNVVSIGWSVFLGEKTSGHKNCRLRLERFRDLRGGKGTSLRHRSECQLRERSREWLLERRIGNL